MSNLGPLEELGGTWRGEGGVDRAPSDKAEDDRLPTLSDFREEIVFTETGLVDNHEQKLYGYRYLRKAWRMSTGSLFHQECGFWMWEEETGMIFRSFTLPRGISVLAGGAQQPDGSIFLRSDEENFGVISGPFLKREFDTTLFTVELNLVDGHLRYEEHTWLKMPGQQELFDHKDSNELVKIAG